MTEITDNPSMKSVFPGKLGHLCRLASGDLTHSPHQLAASGQSHPKTSIYEQNAHDAYEAAYDVIILIAINALVLNYNFGVNAANKLEPIAEVHYSPPMQPLLLTPHQEFVAILEDSNSIGIQISNEANGSFIIYFFARCLHSIVFCDSYLGMVADSTLSIADRKAWINTHMQVCCVFLPDASTLSVVQMAVAQSNSARVMSQRLKWILTELIDVWDRVLNGRRSGWELNSSERGGEALWELLAAHTMASLLKKLDPSGKVLGHLCRRLMIMKLTF